MQELESLELGIIGKQAQIDRLREELRILKEDNLVLKEQIRYWKWQAVSWGAPDYENFEFERT